MNIKKYDTIIYIDLFFKTAIDQVANWCGIACYNTGRKVDAIINNLPYYFYEAAAELIDTNDKKLHTIDFIGISDECIVLPIEHHLFGHDGSNSNVLVFDKKDSDGFWYYTEEGIFATLDLRSIGSQRPDFTALIVPPDLIDYKILLLTALPSIAVFSDAVCNALNAIVEEYPNLAAVKYGKKPLVEENFLLLLTTHGLSHEVASHVVQQIRSLGFIFPKG